MFDRNAFDGVNDLYRNLNAPRVVRSDDDKPRRGFATRKAKAPVKYGSTCPTCGLKKAVSGSCFCDF